MNDLLHSMVRVELISADVSNALKKITDCGIELKEIVFENDLAVCFSVGSADYQKLVVVCEKRGDRLSVQNKHGLHWLIMSAQKRVLFVLGILLLLCFVIYLPTHIFFIRVEGNHFISDREIIASAENCGICFGASRREVRSEKVKNALLSAMPGLRWTGVNTKGCTAIISVKEREREQAEKQNSPAVSSIVASENGIVSSMTVLQGSPLCQVGQAVSKGQILISGYSDNGLSIRASVAKGEIFADTIRTIQAVLPVEYRARTEQTHKRLKYSLRIGKNRINLWRNSGIYDASCGRMSKEFILTLPGGFFLPFAFAVDEITEYEFTPLQMQQTNAETVLHSFAEDYLNQQMIAGTIQQEKTTVVEKDGRYLFDGSYNCREMIGCTQVELIGDYNG